MKILATTAPSLVALLLLSSAWAASAADERPRRPFPQAASVAGHGLRPDDRTPAQLNAAVTNFYAYWKHKYLVPSTTVPGNFKVKFDGKGTTVSEAMGYGMLITAYLAGADPEARNCFDGLNRFRKRYPSGVNPALMCWRVPVNEAPRKDDCATDGDLDMALALLLAHEQWGDATYFTEATNLIRNIGTTLVRPDFSLRLGDWNDAPGQTRPADFMPTHFRSFFRATGDGLWTNVEAKCYAILDELQTNAAPATGLVPDFAVAEAGRWKPAKPKFLEGPHDGDFSYNSCRVPWRIGWAAASTDDARARRIAERFMSWATKQVSGPEQFKAGYRLDGTSPSDSDFDTACFISPTGVAAMVASHQCWLNQTFAYAAKRKEAYYEDTVSLLCLLAMSGNAWLPAPTNPPPKNDRLSASKGDTAAMGSVRDTATSRFTHPGMLNSKAELDFVKAKIKAGVEPWASLLNRLKHSGYGNLNWTPHPLAVVQANGKEASSENEDALAAYAQALLWYYTDQEAYAQKSAEILNGWSARLTNHVSPDRQNALVAAWCGSVFPLAGEILRSSYPKWSEREIKQFSAMLNQAFLPLVAPGNATFNGNWELAMSDALMCIGIFNDDAATFDRGVFLWRKRVPAYFYLSTDGPMPVRPYGTTNLDSDEAIHSYWFKPNQYFDGLCQETRRDYGHHMQMGLAAAINAAEIAFHQGLDLYAENEQRLTAAMEFQAGPLAGEPVPAALFPDGFVASGVKPTWEIAFNHFHNRKGLTLPLTDALIRTKVRPLDFAAMCNLAWESLTHAELDAKVTH